MKSLIVFLFAAGIVLSSSIPPVKNETDNLMKRHGWK